MIGVELRRIEELLPDGAATLRVPVMGPSLCAGFPSPADDFVEDALELPRWLVPNPPATFLWRIAGDSMRDAGIFDGDLACVDRSLKPGHGSVVVAAVDGEMSIKRMVVEGNRARLAFDNADLPVYALEELAEVDVWGVVRFTIRWHVARAGHGR
ncbi:peptidase S24 and S26 domain protein [Methylorubrum populi BJ001]|jgi:DNA polymerase V|uniref:Peptidase S24 and S26 domain protein n=1 Tax=Methylorubrum populi (strain ATCC BAA-705 / NCIMB 13946 / BJ001) TaxID=441620 RepID=B1ZI32_METPB|nr:translesion error-prone DNA polymerase V autoproteolytic subunit [Methylorubrum populi]ACB78518.1 peptidase S24 and S26 domain protein [Methylorubrum populi BJ001]OAH35147.1 peptidase S24 [Methylorubrum populi]PZP66104.1 MAG: peptidase S24 [Methylorubrum populi]